MVLYLVQKMIASNNVNRNQWRSGHNNPNITGICTEYPPLYLEFIVGIHNLASIVYLGRRQHITQKLYDKVKNQGIITILNYLLLTLTSLYFMKFLYFPKRMKPSPRNITCFEDAMVYSAQKR